ncbi:energy transducer TonB [Gynuella sunshinyii]|uniref:Protein TonB n=1 Tax=Gynuella sunshinyii YC6258 TaxID=1445510 RepID=A0A0C5VK97_9GAMM|nr:energy transducer TonB [Gynuella sunshinyii]AJQ93788.1 periplasmic protein TonB, links inner and outer membrane [Gynuella sunshinyii YC6258]
MQNSKVTIALLASLSLHTAAAAWFFRTTEETIEMSPAAGSNSQIMTLSMADFATPVETPPQADVMPAPTTPDTAAVTEPEPDITPEPEPQPEPDITPEPEPQPEPDITPEPEPQPEPDITPEPEPQPEPEIKPEPKPTPTAKQPSMAKPVTELSASPQPTTTSTTATTQVASLSSNTPGAVTSDARAGDNTDTDESARYMAIINALIQRSHRYPDEARQRGQQGQVKLTITVKPNGKIKKIKIDKSSGYALLDREALAIARRINPLPDFPPSMKQEILELTFPIEFVLN